MSLAGVAATMTNGDAVNDELSVAEVLERAADALFIYGWTPGLTQSLDGSMCVIGAIRHAEGLSNDDGSSFVRWRSPARSAFEAWLGAQQTPPVARRSAWIWNDGIGSTETPDAALVIDTLKKCAKELRNEASR